VHPRLLATACRDWRKARLFVAILGRGDAFPLCTEGHEEAGSTNGPSAWHGVTHGEVGMVLGPWCDGVVEVGHGLPRDAELGDEGVHQEGVGDADPCIGGQRHSTLDGLKARRDDVGRAHVVGTEEALKGGAPRELGGCEGGPAAEEVAQDGGVLLLKPLQDMRQGVFEGTGQAMRQTDCVADQAPAVCDELRQGAHRRALGGEGGELVAVCEEEFDLEFGIGGVVFGPAGSQRFTGRSQGERIDGKEPEEILWAQCGHHGAFLAFQADGKRLAVAPRAQGADPRINRFRAVREDQKLSSCRASGLEADIVCAIRPVEANKGCTCFGCLWLHVWSSSRVVQWCQGTCLLALCEGIRESR